MPNKTKKITARVKAMKFGSAPRVKKIVTKAPEVQKEEIPDWKKIKEKPTNPRKTTKTEVAKKGAGKGSRRDGKSTTTVKPVKKVWDPNFKPYFNKGVMMDYEDRPNKAPDVFCQYFVVNKPYDMHCQFSKEKADDYTLSDLGFEG